MARFRNITKGIMCENYIYDKAQLPIGSCIFLSGFPATPGENSLITSLVKKNIHVCNPQYPGTYDSDGHFNLESCIKSVEKINKATQADHIRNLKNSKIMTLPNHFHYMVGYSFGAFIALNSLQFFSSLKTLFLVSPVLSYGPSLESCGYSETYDFIEYVKKTRPHTYRFDNFDTWKGLYNGVYNLTPSVKNTSLENVICIIGEEDDFDLEKFAENHEKIITRFTANKINVKLIRVANGSHSINSLLNTEVMTEILNYIE